MLPAGIPMGDLLPLPRRVLHTPGLLAILYEGINPQRLIYTDGRKLPVDPQPAWMGYSVGRWDGDTLVVETNGFTDRSWLDGIGHPRSEATRITERIRRRDFGHMEIDVTIDDPRSYTKPFSIRYTQTLMPDTDILEYICTENKEIARISAANSRTIAGRASAVCQLRVSTSVQRPLSIGRDCLTQRTKAHEGSCPTGERFVAWGSGCSVWVK